MIKKKQNTTSIKIAFLLIVIFVVGLIVFQYLSKPKLTEESQIEEDPIVIAQNNLQIDLNDCDDSIDPWDKEQMGIKNSEWLNDDTLSVTTVISMLCGGERITSASYKTNINELELNYSTERADQVTNCICAKELNYTISELPKQDYTISLKGN